MAPPSSRPIRLGACRNFIQLCMEGYYDGTPFNRVISEYLVQGGDRGDGGGCIYDKPYPIEKQVRVRFNKRGRLAMAADEDGLNRSQFFVTVAACPDLTNKNTIFGRVSGRTFFNVLRMSEAETQGETPLYVQKIVSTSVHTPYFTDIKPRESQSHLATEEAERERAAKMEKSKGRVAVSYGMDDEDDEDGEQLVLTHRIRAAGERIPKKKRDKKDKKDKKGKGSKRKSKDAHKEGDGQVPDVDMSVAPGSALAEVLGSPGGDVPMGDDESSSSMDMYRNAMATLAPQAEGEGEGEQDMVHSADQSAVFKVETKTTSKKKTPDQRRALSAFLSSVGGGECLVDMSVIALMTDDGVDGMGEGAGTTRETDGMEPTKKRGGQ
ncbi:cyclophilin-type peptidyl-prolyl cis-trans isomerase [Kipferlia bialata]|uniref:Cyclophilin-type peptidyl-prolyl cis-trans isomerase n=1 Tax=Kipferlia bialata TaxID=797122 RepID=A0A9K3CNW4_9EUKA|nr:cyclophilin-type peptidyl-prolyl cis-trans isomerase [Kipferlia bialata]|eukprot:g1422.t1